MKNPIELNIVLFPQMNGAGLVWVAQCVEHDFTAQGATMEIAKCRFENTINTHVALSLKHGETPFQNVPPSPAWFAREFQMVAKSSDVRPVERVPKSRMIFKHAPVPA